MNTQKKAPRPISSHLDLTSLVNKGFIVQLYGKGLLQDTVGKIAPSSRSDNQSQHRIWFILPLTELII